MDWQLAINRNVGALLRLVAVLFAAVGLEPGGGAVKSMSPSVRRLVLRVLRPAESALRRLIVVAAHGLSPKARAKRPAPSGPIARGDGSAARVPPFALFDPRKYFRELATRRLGRGPGPCISFFDEDREAGPGPEEQDDSTPDPAALCNRLHALRGALEDIPAQARRLARVQLRRRAAGKTRRYTDPLRPGWPPGHRQRRTHAVDEILGECQILARRGDRPPDITDLFRKINVA